MRRTPNDQPTDTSAKLKDMGFVHAPSHLFARTCRTGKFIGVQSSKGKPYRLTLTRELVEAAGAKRGNAADVYYKGKQIALVVGSGPLKLSSSGSSALAISCPLLLEKLGVKKGQRFPADVIDGVVFADLALE